MTAPEIERTIPLSHPFKTPDGETVDAITVRKPTVGATRRFIEAIQNGEPADLGMLLSQSGRVLKDDDLAEMLEDDLAKVILIVSGWLPARLRTAVEEAGSYP